jgi:hypothetical protein
LMQACSLSTSFRGVISRAERTDLSNEKCPRSRKIELNDASI